MPQFFWDLQQGSADWYALRSGLPTASGFHHICTPKKLELSASRRKYAARLIAERLLRWQAQTMANIEHIEEGRRNEPLAVAQLEEIFEIETRPIGFAKTNDGRFGASPDRAVVKDDRLDTVVEVKSPTIPVQMERLLFGPGDEYRVQILGQLWVCEADKAIYYSYNPRMPAVKGEYGRDEVAIRKIVDCLEQFSDELERWTEQARRAGAFQAYEQWLPPLDAERGEQRGDDEQLLDDILQGNYPLRFG